MSFNPTTSSLLPLRDAMAAKEVTAADALDAYQSRIAAHDPTVLAYRQTIGDHARTRAKAVDAGEVTGPLAGVPIAIKDCLCHTEGTTACSSKMLEHYRSPFTATAVQRLEDAGAVILGRTSMDEFAMGSSCENCAFGGARNPWDTQRVPGGSSGGSAAAMSADLCAAALGSDTGGSIRQPAALTGIVGFKPTYGRISRWGLVAFASSLDQIGPMTRTVADSALLTAIMHGPDERDATSARLPDELSLAPLMDKATLDEPLNKPRIGLAKQFAQDGNHPAVTEAMDRAIKLLEAQGAEFVEVDLPHTKYGIGVYYIVATAEASSNLARFDGVHYGHRADDPDDLVDLYAKSRSQGFGEEVQRRIMLGTYALSSGYYDAYYNTALKVRRLIRQDFDAAFAGCDAILCPTTTGPAFKIGEKSDDPLAMYLNDIYTVTTNLAGLPGISLPAGFTEVDGAELPIGLQFIGPAFQEVSLLRLAHHLEQALDLTGKRPTL